MTARARVVLNDCRLALHLLEEEKDFQRWRVHWAAAIALVRVVGHALDKADARQDPIVKKVSQRHYKSWKGDAPQHEIFREFIERERNTLLKEYETNIHPLGEVPILFTSTLEPANGGEPLVMTDVVNIGENYFRPMVDGPWEGDDGRDVLALAIQWWEIQLDLIDKEVEEARRTVG